VNRKRLVLVLALIWFLGTMTAGLYSMLYLSYIETVEVILISFALLIVLAFFAPRIRKWAEKQPMKSYKANSESNPK